MRINNENDGQDKLILEYFMKELISTIDSLKKGNRQTPKESEQKMWKKFMKKIMIIKQDSKTPSVWKKSDDQSDLQK